MNYVYVNNFRPVEVYDKKPPRLTKIGEIQTMEVSHSSFNELIYVIYNPTDGLYYAFENNGESKDPLQDLIAVIRTFITKT